MLRWSNFIFIPTLMGLAFGCGIDLADTTEGLDQADIEGEEKSGNTADAECKDWLMAIKERMDIYAGGHDLITQLPQMDGFVPDNDKGKKKRPLDPESVETFRTIGVKTPKGRGKVQGAYLIKANDRDTYTAYCFADVDEDGNEAQWTVSGRDKEPQQVTGPNIR